MNDTIDEWHFNQDKIDSNIKLIEKLVMKIKIVRKFSGLLYNVLKRSMKLCTLWRACDYVCAQAWRPRRRNTYTLLEKECAVYRNISRTRYRCGPAVCAAAYLISYNLRYGGTRGAATCRTTATLAVSELIATLGLIPLCPDDLRVQSLDRFRAPRSRLYFVLLFHPILVAAFDLAWR